MNGMPDETNAPEWGRRRRLAAWLNVLLQSFLLLALLGVVNLISANVHRRYDLTSRRAYEVSATTEDLLKRLNYDVEIWLTANDLSFTQDRTLQIAQQRTQDLLQELSRRTSRLKVHVVGGQDYAQLAEIERNWPVPSPNTLYLLATLPSKKGNKKSVDLYQLYQGNPVNGEISSYHGESVIAQSIVELTVSTKRVVYEIGGHQETLTIEGRTMSALKQFLESNESMEFRPLRLTEMKSIPGDAELVMLLGPQQPLVAQELEVLREYLGRGGSLFVALRPQQETNLETFLEEHGARPGKNLVLDETLVGRPSTLVIHQFNAHPINRGMGNTQIIFPDSCTVDPVDKKDPNWVIADVIRSGARAWAETDRPGGKDRPKWDPGEARGNLPLIVAIEKPVAAPVDPKKSKARLLVSGSVAGLTNQILAPGGMVNEHQVQYTVNFFRWLLNREQIELKPPAINQQPVLISPEAMMRVWWVVQVGLPGLGVVLGIVVWFLRRK